MASVSSVKEPTQYREYTIRFEKAPGDALPCKRTGGYHLKTAELTLTLPLADRKSFSVKGREDASQRLANQWSENIHQLPHELTFRALPLTRQTIVATVYIFDHLHEMRGHSKFEWKPGATNTAIVTHNTITVTLNNCEEIEIKEG